MSSPEADVNDWIQAFGIKQVFVVDEEKVRSPLKLGWDADFIWTWFDSYDEVGSYVIPGLYEKPDVEGERFVIGWFVGSVEADKSMGFVRTLDRQVCEGCDSDGCDSCDGLGWQETIYLPDGVITVSS